MKISSKPNDEVIMKYVGSKNRLSKQLAPICGKRLGNGKNS